MQSFTKIASNGSKFTMADKKFSLPSLPSFGKKPAAAPAKKAGTTKVAAPKKTGTVVTKKAAPSTGTRAGGVGERQRGRRRCRAAPERRAWSAAPPSPRPPAPAPWPRNAEAPARGAPWPGRAEPARRRGRPPPPLAPGSSRRGPRRRRLSRH
jgi:hypothetical protein